MTLTMPERDLVFFSYNHEDGRWLAPLRGALEPYVLDEKLKVWSDRDIETGQRWDAEIQQALERTRVGVLLLSQRFFASKYIREKELPRIVECAEKGALILICVPVADFDPELLRQWNLHAYQFPLEPEDPLNARRASRRERAVVKIAIDVKEAYRRSGDIGSADVPRGEPRYRSAEPLPRAGVESSQRSQSAAMGGLLGVPDLDQQHYVERSDALTRLKELILEGHNLAAGVVSTHRAGRIGLHGMGGMGKTVLAQAFCHDESVRRTFPDGIYWLTLGQEPALLAKQTELLKMIDAQAPFPESAA